MLKLIALTPLVVDMLTSQGRILEKNHFNVISARNIIHLRAPWINIRIFIELNTSAQTVANAVAVAVSWQYTGEVIQERNRLNVLFVANDLHGQIAL